MIVSIRILLLRRSFHGLRDDGQPDWPPSPTRLLGALISGAHSLENPVRTAAARAVIAQISASPAPVIDVPTAVHLNIPGTYTESTWTPEKVTAKTAIGFLDTSHIQIPTKSRSLKPQDAVALAHDEISFHLKVNLNDEEMLALDEAVAAVGYFGRSQDNCEIRLTQSADLPEVSEPLTVRLFPYLRSHGETRGWLRSTLDWYDINFERVLGSDMSINKLPQLPATSYVQPLEYRDYPITSSPGAVIPLPNQPSRKIPDHLRSLHNALPELRDTYSIVPLTQSFSRWADGALVGIGVFPSLPRAEGVPSSSDLESVARDVDKHLSQLIGGVERPPSLPATKAHDSATWTFESTRWVSTTPLRAFPDARLLAVQIEQVLVERFHAKVLELTLRSQPERRHEERWPDTVFSDGFGQWWVELETDIPIAGPLQLGSETESGFGVLRPLGEQQ